MDDEHLQWCHQIRQDSRRLEKELVGIYVYKGKGDALECGSYRGIKLLDQVMKILERVLEKRIRDRVTLDEMQFGFRPGRGTIDAIFIVQQMQERFLAKKKELWMAFVYLEKAFDRVLREIVWWALRVVGVNEWIVKTIQAMCDGATTAVRLRDGESIVWSKGRDPSGLRLESNFI